MVKLLKKLNEISKDKKVIIDFFATWCGPCRKITPQYLKLSEQYKEIEFCKCDVDESTEISEAFDINALPTFVFLLNGKVINTVEGADFNELKQTTEELNNLIVDTNDQVKPCNDTISCECNNQECKEECNKEECNKKECNKKECDNEECNKEECNKEECNKEECDKEECDKEECCKEKCNKEEECCKETSSA